MIIAIRERVTVKRGGSVEIHNPQLPEGAVAEVIIMVEQSEVEPQPLVAYVGKGKGCFTDAAEIDEFLRAERDAWES